MLPPDTDIKRPGVNHRGGRRSRDPVVSCPQGQIVRRQMQQQKIIKELFGDADDEQIDLLNHTAEAVRGMAVETAQIKLDGGVVAKFKVKDGAVVITRAYKSERQRSI